ncbi:MAG: hypoxanthine phosphoribosyltransferase [Myxococcota bacterium]|nr:hypoxanthine phosphoribosyltransferase [Myxococcota bacterium]
MTSNQLRVLISAERLQHRITELGNEIREIYGQANIACICVLKGASLFTSDLIRQLNGETEIHFVQVASYHGSMSSSGELSMLIPLKADLKNKHVLIIEDIVDTGLTVQFLQSYLKSFNPLDVRIVSLLDKPSNREVEVDVDFIGFSIPNEFVVGYGLDFQERFRNLDHVAVFVP